MLDRIKPAVDMIEESYKTKPKHNKQFAGMLFSHLDRLFCIKNWLSYLHRDISTIAKNANKYREREGNHGMHVMRYDNDDGHVDFNDDMELVKQHAIGFKKSLTK